MNPRRFAVALAALVSVAAPSWAQTVADPPAVALSQPPSLASADPDLVVASRFERTLSYYSETERRGRWIRSGVLLGLGATYTGVSLLTLRDSPAPWVQYMFIGIGAASVGAAVIPLLRRDPMERLRATYHGHLRSGMRPTEAMERTEVAWQSAADDERTGRRIAGWAGIAVGAAGLVAVPVLAALRPETLADNQFNLMLLGILGTAAAGVGVASLTIPGPLEESLRLWQIGQGRSALTAQRGFQLGLPSVALDSRGASFALGGTF